MSISFKCSSCGKALKTPDEKAGQRAKCPCGNICTVPKMLEKVATIDCPFCASRIPPTAKKCKHCGETIDIALRAAEEARSAAKRREPNVYMNAGGGASSSSSAAASSSGGGFWGAFLGIASLPVIIGGLCLLFVVISCGCCGCISIMGNHPNYKEHAPKMIPPKGNQ